MSRFREIRDSYKQFGLLLFLKRVLKKVGRLIGLKYESYLILNRTLEDEIELSTLSDKVEISKIGFQDFERSQFYNIFPQEKREIYKERFSNDNCEAFGVKRDGALVYMTWISTDVLKLEGIDFRLDLKPGEGALFDSFALPEARRLGIHSYMNGYRLRHLKKQGLVKAYVAMLADNMPALKSQLKHGFVQGERISRLKFGSFQKYFKKAVHF
jgi:hypothetical protein